MTEALLFWFEGSSDGPLSPKCLMLGWLRERRERQAFVTSEADRLLAAYGKDALGIVCAQCRDRSLAAGKLRQAYASGAYGDPLPQTLIPCTRLALAFGSKVAYHQN